MDFKQATDDFGGAVNSAGQGLRTAWADVGTLWTKSGVTELPVRTGKALAPAGAVVKQGATQSFGFAKDTATRAGVVIAKGTSNIVRKAGIDEDLANIRSDVTDSAGLVSGREGLCSKCSELDLSVSWKDEAEVSEDQVHWDTPLARVIYHAEWCRVCRLLLLMLCRPEHDPLTHPEVATYVQPELQGLSMNEWVGKGWKFTDRHWPFGRTRDRQDGATLFFGPLRQEFVTVLADRRSQQAVYTISKIVAGRYSNARRSGEPTYMQGLQEGRRKGREEERKYLMGCNIFLTIFTSKSIEFPGFILASCVGYGNRPYGEPQALSSFRMRAAHPLIRTNIGYEPPLSYGCRLQKDQINLLIAQWWIQECESKHGIECSQHGWDAVTQKPEFIRVIDVAKMCVVEPSAASNCRYIALSYTWGHVSTVKLTYENRIWLMQEQGLLKVLNQLPNTIIDAMEVVLALGERYLWVDSLVSFRHPTL